MINDKVNYTCTLVLAELGLRGFQNKEKLYLNWVTLQATVILHGILIWSHLILLSISMLDVFFCRKDIFLYKLCNSLHNLKFKREQASADLNEAQKNIHKSLMKLFPQSNAVQTRYLTATSPVYFGKKCYKEPFLQNIIKQQKVTRLQKIVLRFFIVVMQVLINFFF